MSLTSWWSQRRGQMVRVTEDDEEALPVRVRGPVTATGITRVVGPFQIPGQVAGAYAAQDAIGSLFEIPNATRDGIRTAILHTAILYDPSDQGAAINIVLYDSIPVGTVADNAAFGVSDADLLKVVGTLTFTSAHDYSGNQVFVLSGLGMVINTVGTSLYGQCISVGTPTTAAGALYSLKLCFLQD